MIVGRRRRPTKFGNLSSTANPDGRSLQQENAIRKSRPTWNPQEPQVGLRVCEYWIFNNIWCTSSSVWHHWYAPIAFSSSHRSGGLDCEAMVERLPHGSPRDIAHTFAQSTSNGSADVAPAHHRIDKSSPDLIDDLIHLPGWRLRSAC